ncbi:hypothetical protein GLOTRDRAFT_130377 [Gloeophyllum trabeum ATCC 11539]|uniref:Uncharacterized protein n=1 Tax=Gloeophyllum trabeum (strain ATCC 11539 / FP-39264 / Madison 617) TaxID=670483 RepID=S7Q398_GLOTA|nr:uncharacterized protein GLOTRDRAFT_130377 [Gloeophyllum trabeum ATCC 11539]EPQ53987.1 hypothetical protein GLOTRDRAFT_130377 [Gloeophyllum trabeum ATCC 11539]
MKDEHLEQQEVGAEVPAEPAHAPGEQHLVCNTTPTGAQCIQNPDGINPEDWAAALHIAAAIPELRYPSEAGVRYVALSDLRLPTPTTACISGIQDQTHLHDASESGSPDLVMVSEDTVLEDSVRSGHADEDPGPDTEPDPSSSKRWQCPGCERIYKRPLSLQMHLRAKAKCRKGKGAKHHWTTDMDNFVIVDH